jgi:hypothetical protein
MTVMIFFYEVAACPGSGPDFCGRGGLPDYAMAAWLM